ncbi:MAG: GatB/YqeY domain-containing protein [Bacteroidetes bacterium]|nr:MAG: GatB/YqeY domain-containing protein [Bacteroidota bacterium]
MSLEKTINDDIKTAMRAKDKKTLEALRAVKAAILLEKTGKGASGEMAEGVEMKILQKLVKQRKESSELYKAQGRADLAIDEDFQYSVISKYLPEQMDESEIREIITGIISQTNASSMKDMGKVMGMASKQLAGKADNKLISTIVRELLG